MKNQLQKALSLTKKTGDRLIVFDISQDIDPFVVMDLNEYEKIVIGKNEVRGLSEDELTDKINRDIAIWRSDKNNGSDDNDDFLDYNDNFERRKKKSFVPVGDILEKRHEDYIPEIDWEDEDNDWKKDLEGHDQSGYEYDEVDNRYKKIEDNFE